MERGFLNGIKSKYWNENSVRNVKEPFIFFFFLFKRLIKCWGWLILLCLGPWIVKWKQKEKHNWTTSFSLFSQACSPKSWSSSGGRKEHLAVNWEVWFLIHLWFEASRCLLTHWISIDSQPIFQIQTDRINSSLETSLEYPSSLS